MQRYMQYLCSGTAAVLSLRGHIDARPRLSLKRLNMLVLWRQNTFKTHYEDATQSLFVTVAPGDIQQMQDDRLNILKY